MTGLLPKAQVENVWRDDLLEASHTILLPDQLDELVIDLGAHRVEEGGSRGHFKVMEQVLLLSDESMVTPLGLLSELDVLVKLLLRGEGDSVDALKTVVGGLAEPVGRRVSHHFETLDEFSGGNMRASAQINQVAALVSGHALTILDLSTDGR